MAETIRIQGYEHSWAGLKLLRGGDEVLGLRGATWKVTRTRGTSHGTGVKPRAKTRGKSEYEPLTITLLVSDWDKYKKALGDGYMDVFHDLVLMRQELGNDEILKTEFFGCTIDTDGGDESEGEDASEVEIEISFLDVINNGLRHTAGDDT